jgi:hypothetical protein
MIEDPTLSYDPGYAAGATFMRACEVQTDTLCELGLVPRLESWATHHFARLPDPGAASRALSREHFRRGFRDGYWGRARCRATNRPAGLVA